MQNIKYCGWLIGEIKREKGLVLIKGVVLSVNLKLTESGKVLKVLGLLCL